MIRNLPRERRTLSGVEFPVRQMPSIPEIHAVLARLERPARVELLRHWCREDGLVLVESQGKSLSGVTPP